MQAQSVCLGPSQSSNFRVGDHPPGALVLNEANQITIEEASLSDRLDFVRSYGIVTRAFISDHTLKRNKA